MHQLHTGYTFAHIVCINLSRSRKRRHSRWKLSQELKWKIISFLPDYTHAKMAGRKRERYKIEPRISVPFMLELEYESKIIKKTRNMFLAANFPSIQPRRHNIFVESLESWWLLSTWSGPLESGCIALVNIIAHDHRCNSLGLLAFLSLGLTPAKLNILWWRHLAPKIQNWTFPYQMVPKSFLYSKARWRSPAHIHCY